MEKIGVLFVCTGNICRSPTAEAVFRQRVCRTGLESRFLIDSAGTHGYHIGDPPDPRAINAALARGVDMRSLRARKVEDHDFARFDYIYAMDAGHYELLEKYKPAKAKLSLFLDGADVPDPYYGPLKGFDDVYGLIDKGCGSILEDMAKAGILGTKINQF